MVWPLNYFLCERKRPDTVILSLYRPQVLGRSTSAIVGMKRELDDVANDSIGFI
jgi:hypothetical protein